MCIYENEIERKREKESNVDTSCGKFNIAVNSALASFPLDVLARVN